MAESDAQVRAGDVDPDDDPSRMPFLEHLRELRARLRNAVLALIAGFVLAYAFHEELFLLLVRPLLDVWVARQAVDPTLGPPAFNFGSLIEPFWAYFSLSLWAGVFVASPFIFHQLWQFIAPGLYRHERRIALPFALVSAVFFIGGAAFCYFVVLPVVFDFFLGYADQNLAEMHSSLGLEYEIGRAVRLQPTLFMQQHVDLSKKLMLAFGIVFELPLLIFFLAWVGAVTHRGLWRFNRWAVVLAFLVAAILTPPDVVSQVLMACPLILLYNLSILIAWVVTRRRERREAQLLAEP
jgi:sec-independent protein translocase protein TatC